MNNVERGCLLSEIEILKRENSKLKQKIQEMEKRISDYGWERENARRLEDERWSQVWR